MNFHPSSKYVIKEVMPEILEPYRTKIEATIKPYLEINLVANENLTWWQSKFPGRKKSKGGFPYLPKGYDYPKTPEGEYLHLLAQINFAEIPHLEGFPKQGILQFYIINNDRYGLPDLKDVLEQNTYRILYFKKPDFNEEHLTTDFNFLPEKDDSFLEPYPVQCSEIKWTKGYVPISKYDYDFYDRIFSELIDNGMIKDGMENLYEELDEACERILTGANCDIQMGGYRFHLSDDPRDGYSEKDPFDTLLFSIGLVENGSLFFYIQSSALAKCDFSTVLYAMA
ncbi:MAG: YwqG family protein [Trichodesmium sp.]